MRTQLIFATLVLITAGCDLGGAKFISSDANGVGLAVYEGQLWTIFGSPILSDGTTLPHHSLLHLLVVCPDMTGITNRGSESNFGSRQDRYALNWGTSTGVVSVAVSWDKRTDRITVSGASFDRATGNVLVVKCEPSGRLLTTQLLGIGPNARAVDAIRYIRQQMSNDSVISGVRLLEGE